MNVRNNQRVKEARLCTDDGTPHWSCSWYCGRQGPTLEIFWFHILADRFKTDETLSCLGWLSFCARSQRCSNVLERCGSCQRNLVLLPRVPFLVHPRKSMPKNFRPRGHHDCAMAARIAKLHELKHYPASTFRLPADTSSLSFPGFPRRFACPSFLSLARRVHSRFIPKTARFGTT